MAESITWTMSETGIWEGDWKGLPMFILSPDVTSGEFTLRRRPPLTFGLGTEIAKGLDVSILKAEAMRQKLVDQGLPLE